MGLHQMVATTYKLIDSHDRFGIIAIFSLTVVLMLYSKVNVIHPYTIEQLRAVMVV